MNAIIGDLSITMDDGTVLKDRTYVGLAGQWAKFMVGDEWDSLTFGQQSRHTADALAELRRSFGGEQ